MSDALAAVKRQVTNVATCNRTRKITQKNEKKARLSLQFVDKNRHPQATGGVGGGDGGGEYTYIFVSECCVCD